MRNSALVLILCLGGSLLGCSSKPDSAMIEAEINRTLDFVWGTCQIAKVSNFKEIKSEATENIEKRPVYTVTYAVTVELLEDIPNWRVVDNSGRCDMNGINVLIRGNGNEVNKPLKKGLVVTYETYSFFYKSDQGWVPAR